MNMLRRCRDRTMRPAAARGRLVIKLANRQRRRRIDAAGLRRAVKAVLAAEGVREGEISLAIVDNRTIHDVNRRHLKHDEPTDVITFVFQRDDEYVEGEIVVSADMAVDAASRYGWSSADELILYVVHGALHLVGYDDQNPRAKRRMRRRERHYLQQLGVKTPARRMRVAGGGRALAGEPRR